MGALIIRCISIDVLEGSGSWRSLSYFSTRERFMGINDEG